MLVPLALQEGNGVGAGWAQGWPTPSVSLLVQPLIGGQPRSQVSHDLDRCGCREAVLIPSPPRLK